jgi:DNA-binding response OmpR family regulator
MSPEAVVLAVDDEPSVLRLIEIELGEQGFHVLKAHNAEEALHISEKTPPDIAVLDILMPGMSGTELIAKLRARRSIPVIFLTGMDKESDKVLGLDLGADDYIVKPFNPEELTARIRAVLRRSSSAEPFERILRAGDLEIDLQRRLVHRGGEPVVLSANEWRLLQALASSPGRVVQAAELLGKAWGSEYREDTEYLRVWISRLRRKIEPNVDLPSIILTKPGIGYMLEAEPT